MDIFISNKIYIEDASPEVFSWCKQNLEFPNPEYTKKQNLGLWTGNIEPIIVLWEKKGNTAILPYGCLSDLCGFLGVPASELHWESKRNLDETVDYKSNIQLYHYQQQAVNEVRCKSGVLVMPCGSGKTQTALALAAVYSRKTLWITHTQELLNQSKDRAMSCYGISPETVGTITGGKINVGESITFATVQTLSKIDLEPYRNYWDVVIVDECHKAVGTPTKLMMFYKVVSQLNAKIKLGLTATPKRNDGLERCMYALLGPVLYEVPESAVKQNTVPIYVYMKEDSCYDPDIEDITNSDGTINYNEVLNNLCCCQKRNQVIADTVNQMNSNGFTCLVLSDRVEHLKTLRTLVGEDYTMQIFSMSGSIQAKEARKNCIEYLKQKKIRCLFATYQLAKEGLDIPSLDCVVLATPKKDPITVVQSVGRVGRKSAGKTYGTVIDIVDTGFSIFQNYARKRRNIYKKKKFYIS